MAISCGHGAIDDPDASIIYDQTISILDRDEYQQYASDVVVMRIPPSDQCKYSVPAIGRSSSNCS